MSDCDISGFAFDPVSAQVWGQVEYGCYGNGWWPEEGVFVCDALLESNASGEIDDSGDGD